MDHRRTIAGAEEHWVMVRGFDLYAVSTHGRVKNVMHDRILQRRYDSYGHPRVSLYQDGKRSDAYISRLVAAAFLTGFDERRRVHFIDGDPNNCHMLNLRYRRGTPVGQPLYPNRNDIPLRRLVVVETGETFSSVAICAQIKGLNRSSIYKVLRGEIEQHRGLTFEYQLL